MNKRGSRKMARKKSPIKRHSLKNNQKRAAIGLDQKKTWLIFGISVLVIIVLFSVLYSPAREALFGKAVAGGSCTSHSDCIYNEVCGEFGICQTQSCTVDLECPVKLGYSCYNSLCVKSEPEVCNDNRDNDLDGDIDCADSECVDNPLCAPPECEVDADCETGLICLNNKCIEQPPVMEICNDNEDNDGDGYIDRGDADCKQYYLDLGSSCMGHFSCPVNQICVIKDGESNCQTDVCASDFDCSFQGVYFCVEGICIRQELICDDGIDEDRDGLKDCDDPDCANLTVCLDYLPVEDILEPEYPLPIQTLPLEVKPLPETTEPFEPVTVTETICDNKLDDDNDGLIDCDDPDCFNDLACFSAVITEMKCDDGLDNDRDGYIDCADSDCADDPACVIIEICYDGKDNDGDGLIDCADDDCANHPNCILPVCVSDADCEKGFVCLKGECVEEQLVCVPSWICQDANTQAYQLADCSISSISIVSCPHGCLDGVCLAATVLGDTNADGCLSLNEYNDLKYQFKNGLLLDIKVDQYNNLKYEFKNNIGNIVCS